MEKELNLKRIDTNSMIRFCCVIVFIGYCTIVTLACIDEMLENSVHTANKVNIEINGIEANNSTN